MHLRVLLRCPDQLAARCSTDDRTPAIHTDSDSTAAPHESLTRFQFEPITVAFSVARYDGRHSRRCRKRTDSNTSTYTCVTAATGRMSTSPYTASDWKWNAEPEPPPVPQSAIAAVRWPGVAGYWQWTPMSAQGGCWQWIATPGPAPPPPPSMPPLQQQQANLFEPQDPTRYSLQTAMRTTLQQPPPPSPNVLSYPRVPQAQQDSEENETFVQSKRLATGTVRMHGWSSWCPRLPCPPATVHVRGTKK